CARAGAARKLTRRAGPSVFTASGAGLGLSLRCPRRQAPHRSRTRMDLFITGAAGYIGGTVAARSIAAGHRVRGLVRTAQKAGLLVQRGIDPVVGDLDDAEV